MNIKSLFQTVTCICLCNCLFLACDSGLNDLSGKDSKDGENIEEIKDSLVGTWASYKMSIYTNGTFTASDEFKGMFFNLRENGEGLGEYDKLCELQPLTWKRDSDKIVITFSNGSSLLMNILSITETGLTLEISAENYSIRYYFEKERYVLIENNNDIVTQGAVDLGLSVKWAASNLGAQKPEDYGDYFAWGEVEPYYSSLKPNIVWKPGKSQGYCDDSYKWGKIIVELREEYAKYNTKDGKTVLDPEDDAAHVILGGNWRMPTIDEFEELEDNCKLSKAIYNNVLGLIFTSKKNNKSIFFPYNGSFFGTKLYQEKECCLYFSTNSQGHHGADADNVSISEPYVKRMILIDCGRAKGYAIRPVLQE